MRAPNCHAGVHSKTMICILHPAVFLQAVGGCGMKNSVVHALNSLPLVFTMQVGWSSYHEQPQSIAATLAAIDDKVGCCSRRQHANDLVVCNLMHCPVLVIGGPSRCHQLATHSHAICSWTLLRCTRASGAECGTMCCAPFSAAAAHSTQLLCAQLSWELGCSWRAHASPLWDPGKTSCGSASQPASSLACCFMRQCDMAGELVQDMIYLRDMNGANMRD